MSLDINFKFEPKKLLGFTSNLFEYITFKTSINYTIKNRHINLLLKVFYKS